MTHYDTLGVPRDATPEDIKRAYRRASAQHHPDRPHGDEAQMTKVNIAYKVLSDPAKRKHYDETGEDDAPSEAQSITEEATARLAALFDSFLEQGDATQDCIRAILQGMQIAIEAERREIKKFKHRLAELERKRKLVRRKKPGVDAFAGVITLKLEKLSLEIAKRERYVKVLERVRELAAEYEGCPEPPPDPRGATASDLLEMLRRQGRGGRIRYDKFGE